MRALFIGLLLAASTAFAGPLDDGLAAYQARDYELARERWQPLANQGNPDAQFNMALLYANGLGVAKNPREAAHWYTLAARQGHADAQYNLGLIYFQGQGTFRSNKDAIDWWRLAASKHHLDASFNLGLMYAYGMGIKQDTAAALREWEAAASQGHRNAAATLVRVYTEGLFGVAPNPTEAARWQSTVTPP